MANKVFDISNTPVDSALELLSQTPRNYDKDNFYIKGLQQKVDYEWKYRPNRVLVEFELGWNTPEYWKGPKYPILKYLPLEVVVQTVKTDKGKAIAEDCRRLVFKNIRESRFAIGQKWRFAPDYSNCSGPCMKNTWLTTNKDNVSATSSVVIERCNGTLGSVYLDEQGVGHYHYEPVIQGRDLTATTFNYNQVAVSPQAGLLITCQHNKYTAEYQINQRFVVGYDAVYRIKAINKFYSNSTNNPYDVGLIQLYLEITEKSSYDDFVNRIAYESEPVVHIEANDVENQEYYIDFEEPKDLPTDLLSQEVAFKPVLKDSYGEIQEDTTFEIQCQLENWNAPKPFNILDNPYVKLRKEGDVFYLKRTRIYLGGNLKVKFLVLADTSPTGEDIVASFELVMRTIE